MRQLRVKPSEVLRSGEEIGQIATAVQSALIMSDTDGPPPESGADCVVTAATGLTLTVFRGRKRKRRGRKLGGRAVCTASSKSTQAMPLRRR